MVSSQWSINNSQWEVWGQTFILRVFSSNEAVTGNQVMSDRNQSAVGSRGEEPGGQGAEERGRRGEFIVNSFPEAKPECSSKDLLVPVMHHE